MRLPLIVPDVNLGEYNFTVNKKREIVYGLGAIKGLGEGPVAAIIAARTTGGPFVSLLDFCRRVDGRALNKRTLEALVRAGALDSLQEGGKDLARAVLSAAIADTMKAAEQSSRNNAIGVQDMFGDINPVAESSLSAPGSRVRVRPWSEQQRLAAERETLGLYFSGHPVDEFLPEIDQFTRDRLANLKPERESQTIAGLVVSTRTMKSKRGDTIAVIQLDDRTARIEVSVFGKEFEQFRDLLQKDRILVIDCFVSVDDYSGAMRGRARHLMTLDQARVQFARSLDLRLRQDLLAPDFLDVLATILEAHRPSPSSRARAAESATDESPALCPVRIFYERPDSRGCLVLGSQWQVQPGQQLLQRLQEEFGRTCVGLSYQS